MMNEKEGKIFQVSPDGITSLVSHSGNTSSKNSGSTNELALYHGFSREEYTRRSLAVENKAIYAIAPGGQMVPVTQINSSANSNYFNPGPGFHAGPESAYGDSSTKGNPFGNRNNSHSHNYQGADEEDSSYEDFFRNMGKNKSEGEEKHYHEGNDGEQSHQQNYRDKETNQGDQESNNVHNRESPKNSYKSASQKEPEPVVPPRVSEAENLEMIINTHKKIHEKKIDRIEDEYKDELYAEDPNRSGWGRVRYKREREQADGAYRRNVNETRDDFVEKHNAVNPDEAQVIIDAYDNIHDKRTETAKKTAEPYLKSDGWASGPVGRHNLERDRDYVDKSYKQDLDETKDKFSKEKQTNMGDD